MKRLDVIGNLGQDIALRANKNTGEQFLSGSVAISESFTDADGIKQKSTEWIDIILSYDRYKNLEPYLKKGTRIFVSGYPKIRRYKNEETKKLETYFQISANHVEFFNLKEKEAE